LAQDADVAWVVMIESTIICAYQDAEGKKIQKKGIKCFYRGFSAKIHAACGALGNPIRFILTGGESSDCAQALALLDGMRADVFLADKGYDADCVVKASEYMGFKVVLPSKSNRKKSRYFNKEIYKQRNLTRKCRHII
jgi:transposase